MKSRLLSSATGLLFLLLGLVNTNLFAQVSDASAVKFQIKDAVNTTVWSD